MIRVPAVLALLAVHVLAAATSVTADPPPPEKKAPSSTEAAKPPAASASPTKAAPPPAPAPAPTSLEGVVLSPDGKPVRGAVVMARSERQPDRPPRHAVTDAEGRFAVEGAVAPPYHIAVDAAGFAVHVSDEARPGASLRIRLAAGASIDGRVLDSASGGAAAGARVEARFHGAVSSWEYPDFGTRHAVADAEGRYKLTALRAASYSVSAVLRGAGRGTKEHVRTGERADIVLLPSSIVAGTVVGPDGKPVAGASVRPVRETPGFFSGGQPAASRSDGTFDLGGLEPGEYKLLVRHPRYAPSVATASVSTDTETSVEIRLHTGAVVTGRLVDPKDRPVYGGGVTLVDIDGTSIARPNSLLSADAIAGPDGTFRLSNVPAGPGVLEVHAAGYGIHRVDVSPSPRDRQIDVGDVHLDPGLTIRGRVRAAKEIVPGARLGGFRRGPLITQPAETFSEADGSFTLGGLEPGHYTVWVEAEGFARTQKEIEAGTENADLVLEPGGVITGTVVDAQGAAVTSYTANAQAPAPEGERMPRFAWDQVADPDGRFNLKGLAAGTYVVTIQAPDLARKVVPKISVSKGATADVGRIKLGPGARIAGVVVDGHGSTVAGARVSVDDTEARILRPAEGSTTDLAGAFELRGLDPGTANLRAEHPSFVAGRTTVEVSVERPVTDARIVLSTGGRVTGTVRRRDGAPVANMSINVMPSGRQIWNDRPLQAAVGADGTYSVDRLPPGSVWVALFSGSGYMGAAGARKSAEVREGETTVVDFSIRDILVSGQVARAGTPMPGCYLRFMPAKGGGSVIFSMPKQGAVDGPMRYMARTGEDGSYQALVDEAGPTMVSVQGPDGRSYPGREVEIPDADSFTFNVNLNTVRLAGTVVDRDSGEPIANATAWASRTDDAKRGRGFGFGPPPQTGADGRFELEVDPGEYDVSARAADYSEDKVAVTVAEGGAPEVRIALSRGLSISGRIGRFAASASFGTQVSASSAEGPGGFASGQALADGSFRIGGLKPGTYNLVARSLNSVIGLRARVDAGAENIVIEPTPMGRIAVRVLTAEGAPADGAHVQWTRWNGETFAVPQPGGDVAGGAAEITAPAGTVEVTGSGKAGRATAVVQVPPNGVASVELRFQPPGQPASKN